MILIEATIYYKGYNPNSLSYGSNKRICCSCDICGRVRWLQKNLYRDLCPSCAKKGLNNPMFGLTGKDNPNYGLKRSKNHIKILSEKMSGKNNPMFNIHLCGELNGNYKNSGKLSPFYGGQDLVRHHYIYDHNDLNKYTTLMTRSKHSKIHAYMKKLGIKVPHLED